MDLLCALLVEILDRPLFSGHLDVFTVQIDFTVVHDELRGVWGGRSLVRQVHDIDAVDAEREGVLLKVKGDGELPVVLLIMARRISFVLVQYRVDRWVVEAPKTEKHLVSKSSRKMARRKQLENTLEKNIGKGTDPRFVVLPSLPTVTLTAFLLALNCACTTTLWMP